jgi:transcriptional regulator with XRE-family HTH domain
MKGGELIREARKRAGLSQRDLAELLGTTQAVIARWETGRRSPSFERVVEAVRACGFELAVSIVNPDDQHSLLVQDSLQLTPTERLDRVARSKEAIDRLREAIRQND